MKALTIIVLAGLLIWFGLALVRVENERYAQAPPEAGRGRGEGFGASEVMRKEDFTTNERLDFLTTFFIGLRMGQDRLVKAMMAIFSGYLTTQLWPASTVWVLAAALALPAGRPLSGATSRSSI